MDLLKTREKRYKEATFLKKEKLRHLEFLYFFRNFDFFFKGSESRKFFKNRCKNHLVDFFTVL